jgi:hypothetical protein
VKNCNSVSYGKFTTFYLPSQFTAVDKLMIKITARIWKIEPDGLSLRCKGKIPHQSILGNSSNFKEIPRQACPLMAGPTPKGVDLRVAGGLQRLASPQILSLGVSSQSFGVDLIKVGD